MASVAVGTAIGWTSPVSPKLSDKDLTDTPLSSVPSAQELAWVGALVPLGALIGIPSCCHIFRLSKFEFFFAFPKFSSIHRWSLSR